MLPGVERPERIGEFGDYPESRDLDELFIDCKEDQILNDRDQAARARKCAHDHLGAGESALGDAVHEQRLTELLVTE
jgi:hypothetical protein